MTSPTESAPTSPKEQPAFLPLVFVSIFGIGWAVGSLLQSLCPPALILYFIFLLVTSLIVATIDLRRLLPMQNIIAVAGLTSFIAVVLEIVNAKTRLPFGQNQWLDMFGTPVLNLLRWPIPFIFVLNLLNSRAVTRLLLQRCQNRRNIGLVSLGLAAVLTAIANLGIEQFETVDFWFAFGVHLLIAVAILVAATPWLIVKKPGPAPTPTCFPLIIWFLFLGVLFGHS